MPSVKSIPGVEIRDNSIRISFTVRGQRHKKTFTVDGMVMAPTSPNVRAAARLVHDIKDSVRLGTFEMQRWFPDDVSVQLAAKEASARKRTVAQQLKHYLTIAKVESSTKKGYESAARFWTRACRAAAQDGTIGDTPIDELLYSDLQAALTTFTGSGKTANNYLSVLAKALQVAVHDGILQRNPAANEDLRSEYQEPEPDPFDASEVRAILGYMSENYPEPVYNMTDFWAHSGLRTSEMYGASWSAVDWPRRTILVHRANVRGVEKETTKTKRARHLPLNSRAMAALERQKAYTFASGRHVFLDPRYESPWDDERAFRRSFWTPALAALGIRYRSPYQLRHSFATFMLMAGVTPAAAAKRMGHSVQIFFTRYAKWIDGDLDAVQDQRLEAFLSAGRLRKPAAGNASGFSNVQDEYGLDEGNH